MARYMLCMIMFLNGIFLPVCAVAISPGDAVSLKEAGISEKIIKEVIESNAITRALITVEELIEMEKAGMGDETILLVIRKAEAPVSELDEENASDRALTRTLRRQEMALEMRKRELSTAVKYLSDLASNPEIVRLVQQGKIASGDYADIVKYLKQYARDEETIEYLGDGDIEIGIQKQ